MPASLAITPPGAKKPMPSRPHGVVVARHRAHDVALAHGAQHRAPDRRVVEGRLQLVEAQHADVAVGIQHLDRELRIAAAARAAGRRSAGPTSPPRPAAGRPRAVAGSGMTRHSTRSKCATLGPRAGWACRPAAARSRRTSRRAAASRTRAAPREAERAAADHLLHRQRGSVAASRSGMMKATMAPTLPSASGSSGKGCFSRQRTVRSSAAHAARPSTSRRDAERVARCPALEARHHVARQHRLAVVEAQALAQGHGPGCRRPRRCGPATICGCTLPSRSTPYSVSNTRKPWLRVTRPVVMVGSSIATSACGTKRSVLAATCCARRCAVPPATPASPPGRGPAWSGTRRDEAWAGSRRGCGTAGVGGRYRVGGAREPQPGLDAAQGAPEQVERLVHAGVVDDQRRAEADRVAHGADDQPVADRLRVEGGADPQRRLEGGPGRGIRHQLDAEHEAGAAHLAHDARAAAAASSPARSRAPVRRTCATTSISR